MDTQEKVARVREIEREVESLNMSDEGLDTRLILKTEQSGMLRDLGWDMVLNQEAISSR